MLNGMDVILLYIRVISWYQTLFIILFGLENQHQLGDSMDWPHITPKTGRMIFHLCLQTSESEASTHFVGPNLQWARA